MAIKSPKLKKWIGRLNSVGLFILLAILVIVLILWLTGALGKKIAPGSSLLTGIRVAENRLTTVRMVSVNHSIVAVGTIRPIGAVTIAPRIVGRIVLCLLKEGDEVHKAQILIRLDDTQLKAEAAQAVAALTLARTQLHQAIIDQRRDHTLFVSGDVTPATVDLANTAVAAGRSVVARAKAALYVAKTILSYATIRSPINGIVMHKYISVGDTVMPGQKLANLYNPSRLQLAAIVPESLAQTLRIEECMPVQLTGIPRRFKSHIRQIAPFVNAKTRSFIVKATAKFPTDVWPGMYGNLMIPLGVQHVLAIPQSAIEHVGQLYLVELVREDRLIPQVIQPGRHIGRLREILSGLAVGQRVVIDAGPTSTRPGAAP